MQFLSKYLTDPKTVELTVSRELGGVVRSTVEFGDYGATIVRGHEQSYLVTLYDSIGWVGEPRRYNSESAVLRRVEAARRVS